MPTRVGGRLFGRAIADQAMNAQREAWMQVMARRELRMIDTGIMLGLQQGTAFFASSALLALGGCFALFGASDQVIGRAQRPAARTRRRRAPLFEVKVIGLVAAPGACLLQVRLVLPAVQLLLDPDRRRADRCARRPNPAETERAVQRAAEMNMLAGKHFNAGLRGIFFSIGYLGWFVGPVAFALSTLAALRGAGTPPVLFRGAPGDPRPAMPADQSSGPGNTESMRPVNL